MEKVVSRQTHFKKVLEKQLNELEVRQKQSETRRQKQIRDLGVDLSRIQKTSRDLESVNDLVPRRRDERRGSLPVIDNNFALSYYFESSKAPRRTRRLSCIATLPSASSGVENCQENSDLKIETSVPESFPQVRSRKTDTEETSSGLVSTVPMSGRESTNGDLINPLNSTTRNGSQRRNSLDSSEMDFDSKNLKRGNSAKINNYSHSSNNSGHNVTTVCVHEDSKNTSKELTSYDDDTLDVDSESMFQQIRNRGRRSSEPAVGGFFLRRLQAKEFNGIISFQQRNNSESEELKRSIQTNLPSNIVAEEDELETEDIFELTANEIEPDPRLQRTAKLFSIWENEQDGVSYNESSASENTKGDNASRDKTFNSKGNKNSTKSGNFTTLRQRRKSDGDVLTFLNARKTYFEGKTQVLKSNRGGGSKTSIATSRNSYNEEDEEKKRIWQTVRKCRYLRGYDPPEMSEPADVTKFVFGREKGDSFSPKLK
uniref:Uncharacterized protein n=1 Tax=Arion vulgaris TaxID=1028688 RepID=A0A0B7AID5_9EUPU